MTTILENTDIDPDRAGKQLGHFSLPYSSHDDAWGVIRIPLAVIGNGTGPTILLQGGNHGDEYEGPIVLGEIIRDLDPARVSGRLIIVPSINLPAVQAACRVSPLDGLNFNRTFPGNPLGSPTEQICAFVHDQLFAMADVFVDLHSGGSSLDIVPSAAIEPAEDAEQARQIDAAVRAFDAPMRVIISNRGDPRTSTASAVKAGLVVVGTEMGGAGTVSPAALKICRRGVWNLLDHFGVVESAARSREHQSGPVLELAPGAHVLAEDAGIFEPSLSLGESVREGQIVGRIHCVWAPRKPPVELFSACDGVLYGLRHPGQVRDGNCCAVVASLTRAE